MSIWFGYEWEIAASAIDAAGAAVPIPDVLKGFDTMVVENLKHVDGERSGWWLESGGRFYRDASENGQAHNEYASPECAHPDELLRQSIAADRMMLHLAGLLRERMGYGKVMVSKSNVSHATVTSWGAHENYETSRPVPHGPMLAWLASRFLLSGSGGLDVTYPGIRFSLSPRIHFFSAAVNHCTQWTRGLHNVGKAVPNGIRHREHVIAGDGNRAALSTWLKFGCTALVVRMLDAGCFPAIQLEDPVAAAKTFALDRNLAARVKCRGGRELGMLDIQRLFLDAAAVAAVKGLFPKWAPRVIDEWRRVLGCVDRMGGWRALSTQLDWPAKLELFERVLERAGWTWERIAEVNARVDQAIRKSRKVTSRPRVRDTDQEEPFSQEVLRQLTEEVDSGILGEFSLLRQQLAVVDARYMELGDESLHDRICGQAEEAGLFDLKPAAGPLELPSPGLGRAGVRASLVSKFGWKTTPKTAELGRTYATWTGFVAEGKYLSMPDVNGVPELEWKTLQREPAPIHVNRRSILRDSRLVEEVRHAVWVAGASIDSGEYEYGHAALQNVRETMASSEIHSGMVRDYWKHIVRLQGRRQRDIELDDDAAMLEELETDRLEALWESCNARCHLGLAGHPAVRGLAELVMREVENRPHPRVSGLACWKSHLALWHNRNCRFSATLGLLEPTLVNGEFTSTSFSVRVRILTQIAEARRMLGDLAAADRRLTEAAEICRREHLQANLWDLAMTGRARLLVAQGMREEARHLLAYEIMPAQRRLGMPGWLRSFILIARIAPEIENRRRWLAARNSLARDVNHFSGYARCPLMTRILDHWETWCRGGPDPAPSADAETADFFWGV